MLNSTAILSHSVLFPLFYSHLLKSYPKTHTATSWVRRCQPNESVIKRLIWQTALKSMVTSSLPLFASVLSNVTIKQALWPAKAIGLYYLRLKMIMTISVRCDLDLHSEQVSNYLSTLMSLVSLPLPDGEYQQKRLPPALLTANTLFLTTHPTLSPAPWLTGLHVMTKLTLDGQVTYQFGHYAYRDLQRLWLNLNNSMTGELSVNNTKNN